MNILEKIDKIKKNKFKGYSRIAIKNSVHQISLTVIAKIGGLFFTAIIARVLMPELFGLYSLVLFTISTFVSFSDMGMGTSLVRFVSMSLAKGDVKKAKSYAVYHFKIKIILTTISFFALIISAKFLSTTYYQKPIFLALLVGSFLIVIQSMIGFIENFFRSTNQFQGISIKETFFQIVRILIAPILIIVLLKYALTQEISLVIVVLSIFIPYSLTLIFFALQAKKKIVFLKNKSEALKDDEKKDVRKFIIPLAISLICYTILDQTDIILLGKFVNSEFIGYYAAAFFLIGPATALATLSTALFPIFSRLEGEQLKRGLRRSVAAIFILSLLFTVIIVALAPWIVKLAYGNDYLTAISLLRLGALVIIPSTVTAIYVNFFISKGQSKLTAKILIFLTIVKLILGYLLVAHFVKVSLFAATVGVISARVIIEYLQLGILLFFIRRSNKIDSA